MAVGHISNDLGQSIIVLWTPDGEKHIYLGVGEKAIAGETDTGAWLGVATHANGGTLGATDGLAAIAGVDGTTVTPIAVDSAGKISVAVSTASGNLTDGSADLTAAATSEEVFAANANRKYLFIQNVDTAEAMWINFGVAAVADQPSIKLEPGQSWESGSFVPTQSLNVIAATINHPYTAKEG